MTTKIKTIQALIESLNEEQYTNYLSDGDDSWLAQDSPIIDTEMVELDKV